MRSDVMNVSTIAYESAELPYRASNAQSLGFELFEGAMRGEVALSDPLGCFDFLIDAHPDLYLDVVCAALRLAIDLTQHTARNLDRQPGEGGTACVSG